MDYSDSDQIVLFNVRYLCSEISDYRPDDKKDLFCKSDEASCSYRRHVPAINLPYKKKLLIGFTDVLLMSHI